LPAAAICPLPSIGSGEDIAVPQWTPPLIGYNARGMTLTSGTKLGPYEIVGSLGAGDMGEVEPFAGVSAARARRRNPERSEGSQC
jgi:hypothetical protein